MRILQTITDDDRRGAQIFACDLGRALSELGEHVETVALTASGGTLEVDALGPSRRSRRTIAALRRRLVDFDVVVGHGSTTLPVGVIAAIGTGIPLVYRQISDPRFWAASLHRRLRVAALLRRTDRVVSLSERARASLVEHYRLDPSRIAVIANGVPHRRFPLASDESRFRRRDALGLSSELAVTFLGALVPEKGADIAIRSVAGLEGIRLLVAGTGPERASLERLADELQAPVDFLGQVDDPISVLHASDLLVFPSRGGDSMPATIIEAQFAGVPAIASSVGSVGDLIDSGRSGLLVSVAEPHTIRAAIVELRDDPVRRRSLAATARADALDSFDLDVVAVQWQRLLHDAVSCRRAQPRFPDRRIS